MKEKRRSRMLRNNNTLILIHSQSRVMPDPRPNKATFLGAALIRQTTRVTPSLCLTQGLIYRMKRSKCWNSKYKRCNRNKTYRANQLRLARTAKVEVNTTYLICQEVLLMTLQRKTTFMLETLMKYVSRELQIKIIKFQCWKNKSKN